MTHTAQDLFPGWYNKGINRDATDEELTIRKKAIADIVKLDDASQWIKILKVYLGKIKFGDPDYDAVADLAKKGDDNFSIQNENLVRLIAGCAIAQKIDNGKTYVSDFLALALLTSKNQKLGNSLIPELLSRADFFLRKASDSSRTMEVKIESTLKSTTKVEIPDATTDPNILKTHSDAVIKTVTAIQKDLNTTNANVNAAFEMIKRNFIALSEETNVLWWLFGAHSEILEKSFSQISPELLSITVALELCKLTESIPGIGGIDAVIHRSVIGVGEKNIAAIEIEKIIASLNTHEEKLKQFLPEVDSNLNLFVPLLKGVTSRVEFAGTEWKAIYAKSNSVNLAEKVLPQNFSLHLYRELMLLRVYQEIQN